MIGGRSPDSARKNTNLASSFEANRREFGGMSSEQAHRCLPRVRPACQADALRMALAARPARRYFLSYRRRRSDRP